MAIETYRPDFRWDSDWRGQPAHYRLHFSDGTFYVGATADFKARIKQHRLAFRTGQHSNPGVRERLAAGATLECVEVTRCRWPHTARLLERNQLKKHRDNPLMLNVIGR